MCRKTNYPIAVLFKIAAHARYYDIAVTDRNIDQLYASMRNFTRDRELRHIN